MDAGRYDPTRDEMTEHESADDLVAVDCPLCGAEERHVVHHAARDVNLGHEGRFDIVECSACAVRYVDPQPVGATLAAYYARHEQRSYANHRVGRDLDLPPEGTRAVLAETRGYPDPGTGAPSRRERRAALAWLEHPDRRWRVPAWIGHGRLLDVGCGTGAYLAAMQALGWDVTGVEWFEHVARGVSEHHGVPCHVGSLPELDLPRGGFDVITLWHMIEHAPDPVRIIRRARELLSDGGRLLIGVPVYDCEEEALLGGAWLGYDVPRHLFVFSRERLRSFLEQQGFVVDWMRSEPAPWILKHGLDVMRMGFVQRQLFGHRRTRQWIANRLAARDRSGKVVALARKP